MIVLVALSSQMSRLTTAAIARQALSAYPALAQHDCLNAEGARFGAVIGHTPMPHLLEHLIIENIIADRRTPETACIVGATNWIDQQQRLARVQVSFTDDLVALNALDEAVAFVNQRMEL